MLRLLASSAHERLYAAKVSQVEDVSIAGEMIRLGQFLKFSGFAESGAHAGQLIADGDVLVDGEVETRRGRQLHRGNVVRLNTAEGAVEARVS